MNVKANMLIKDIEGLDDLFVAPSGGDESLAIGACYAYLDQIENMEKDNLQERNKLALRITNLRSKSF